MARGVQGLAFDAGSSRLESLCITAAERTYFSKMLPFHIKSNLIHFSIALNQIESVPIRVDLSKQSI